MKKLLGPHLGGQWTSNLEILRKWQPRLVLVLRPEVDKVQQLRDACPDTIIVGRFFHDDSYYASNINARPISFAREIHQEIVGNPVTPLLDYAQSNNEVCQDWAGIQRLNEFTLDWMFLADQSQAYKCAILAFSVGNPDLPHKPGDPAGFDGRMLYWQQVLPSLNYAQRNDHILLLHAYGYPDMFHPNADWYIYRYERQVQANLRTLGITNLKYAYGEIGIDRLIVNGKGGYKVVTNDQDYTNQLLQWERDLQNQDLLLGGAIFTFGDSGGWDTYDIASTSVASMIATHYTDHAGDYNTPDNPDDGGHTVFIPDISTGTPATEPSLPRDVDPRAAARGTVIETPSIASGQEYWRVKRLYTPNEDESDRLGPDRHILANVLSVNGGRQVDAPLLVTWGSGGPNERATIHTKKNDAFEFTADHALTPGTFTIEVIDGRPSERVVGIKMGANRADGSFNQNAHTSTLVDFELVTMPAVAVPTPVTPPPAPVEPPPTKPTPAWVTAPAGARLRAAPSTDSATLAIVKYGEEVRIIGVESILGWLLVRYGDQAGYMASRWIGLAAPEPTPEPEQPVSDNWNRAWPIVLKIEGGLSTDRSDKGNYRPDGTFVGTKWGISALSHPTVDIVNLTKEQALEIYHRNYWLGGGCDKLPWPLALLHFDAYVQNEVAAKKFLAASNGDPDLYMAERIDWYTRADTWDNHGRGWMRRCATMLREVAKSK